MNQHVDTSAQGRRGLRVEWITIALIVACYGLWALGGTLLWSFSPLLALAALTIAVALQSSLMHEASHGHPTRSGTLNEILVGLPIGLVYPFRRFRSLHLRHHADERLTDPFDDPESYYRAIWQHEQLPGWMQALLRANNTMVGRFFMGPAMGSIGFLISDFRLLAAGDRAVRRAWVNHAVGLAVLVPILALAFRMPLWAYLLPVYLGQSLISIRTFAEHQWDENPDGRTVIVERSPLAFLFLNNNLHFVHHKKPNVAWYDLPTLFRERREEWIEGNGRYVYPNYFALFIDYAVRAKEPVVHPALRRAPEAGTTFRPRIRARNVNGLGTAPVPAQPSQD